MNIIVQGFKQLQHYAHMLTDVTKSIITPHLWVVKKQKFVTV